MRDHNDIRFKVKKIEKPSDKIFLLIQVIVMLWLAMSALRRPVVKAVLGGINLSDAEYKNGDNQPHLEAYSVFRHLNRIMKGTSLHVPSEFKLIFLPAVVEVAVVRKSGAQIKHGLEMCVVALFLAEAQLNLISVSAAPVRKHGKIALLCLDRLNKSETNRKSP